MLFQLCLITIYYNETSCDFVYNCIDDEGDIEEGCTSNAINSERNYKEKGW